MVRIRARVKLKLLPSQSNVLVSHNQPLTAALHQLRPIITTQALATSYSTKVEMGADLEGNWIPSTRVTDACILFFVAVGPFHVPCCTHFSDSLLSDPMSGRRSGAQVSSAHELIPDSQTPEKYGKKS